jgi:hypothetical protein
VHVCAIGTDTAGGTGYLLHAIRRADGSWSPWGDVRPETIREPDSELNAPNIAFVTQVECGLINGALAVYVVDEEGGIRRTVRRRNGTWSIYRPIALYNINRLPQHMDIPGGAPASALPFRKIAVAI